MQREEAQQAATESQALVVDRARRASAARAIALVFLVLSTIGVLSTLYLPAPPAVGLILAASVAAYAGVWWMARDPRRASQAGLLMVVTHLTVVIVASAFLSKPLDVVQVAYNTALTPLVAAVTMRSRGVIGSGVTSALALAVQVALHPEVGTDFVSPSIYFAGAWVVATFSSIASNRALLAHADEEQRALVAQTAARRAEARYQLVAEHVSDLVSLFDSEGRCLYASPSHRRVLGDNPEDLVGRRAPELVHPDDLPAVETAFLRALSGDDASAVARLRTQSGEYRWFHFGLSGVSALDDKAGERGVAVSARDVTEQRTLSEALERTRRMEALGNLAGGVAHDFNNLLMVVQSCAELAASHLPPEHPARAELGDLGTAVGRAAALTQQLLTFARRQVLPLAEGSVLASTASELGPILGRLCGDRIRFSLDTHGSSRAVDASAVQLEQVLMNLAANACDAMPQGGELSVDVRDRALVEDEVSGLAAGEYVELCVRDTGTGMSGEVQERMFEPFYTTKASGRGTGLGLATVFGLVTQLRGRISVSSAPGAGSTFTVLMPRSSPAPAQELPAVAVTPAPEPLDVLVIDDEAAVRSSVARMLVGAGHRITEADTVERAVAVAQTPGLRFGGIVTDVVVGADDGIAMLERLRSAQPGAAVVVMSGFSPSPERVAAVRAGGAEFLAKPFAAKDLLIALDRARARVASPRQ